MKTNQLFDDQLNIFFGTLFFGKPKHPYRILIVTLCRTYLKLLCFESVRSTATIQEVLVNLRHAIALATDYDEQVLQDTFEYMAQRVIKESKLVDFTFTKRASQQLISAISNFTNESLGEMYKANIGYNPFEEIDENIVTDDAIIGRTRTFCIEVLRDYAKFEFDIPEFCIPASAVEREDLVHKVLLKRL